jgi:hypothetical protein
MFSRPLIIDSSLPASETRGRVRAFATWRGLSTLEAYRRRQIVSWRLSRANEDFVFQPEYGDRLDVEGARFIVLVEPSPAGRGSRIRGRVVVAPLTRVIVAILMLAITLAAVVALAQGREPAAKVIGLAAALLGILVLLIRSSLRLTSRLVDARLRQCLEGTGSRAAA